MYSRFPNASPSTGLYPALKAANGDKIAPANLQSALGAGTPVQTPTGVQLVSALSVGDTVVTRAGSAQPIVRIEHLKFSKRQLEDDTNLRPIRIDADALPGMTDGPAILVSPDCLIQSAAGADDTGAPDARHFPARAFCDGGMVRRVIPDEGLHYIRLHFATTQEICVCGVWMEVRAEAPCGSETFGQAPAKVFDLSIAQRHRA